MEVRQRGMGAGWEGRGCSSEPDLHPPGESEFRGALDEGGGVLRQSQAHEQVERKRPNNAELFAQVRATGAPRESRSRGTANGKIFFFFHRAMLVADILIEEKTRF